MSKYRAKAGESSRNLLRRAVGLPNIAAELWVSRITALVHYRAALRYGKGERSDDLLAEIDDLKEEVKRTGMWVPFFDVVGA